MVVIKVPGSKDNIISECSFCDSFAWKQGGICKCSLLLYVDDGNGSISRYGAKVKTAKKSYGNRAIS